MGCNEIWDYNDEKHVQKLVGFIELCNNCHNIKHMGRTLILVSEGTLDFDQFDEHFCKINNCKSGSVEFLNNNQNIESGIFLTTGSYISNEILSLVSPYIL